MRFFPRFATSRRLEQDLDDELQFHLDHKIEESLARGLSPTEARREAMRAMDGLTQRKEELRDLHRVRWLSDFADDARYALRTLRRAPALTAFVVVTLALGIGLTATSFSMADAIIFRPYPVPQPRRVMTLVGISRDSSFETFSYREYLDIRAHATSYSGVLAHTNLAAVGFSADSRTTPRVKGGMLVSGNYFEVLGIQPRLGRAFRSDEDQVPGRDAVVVLNPDFWKQEFASDPSIVGRSLRLNGNDFTVIGVAPDGFPGLEIFGHPDFYLPLAMAHLFSTDPQKNFFEDRADRELNLKGRLKPGATLLQARSELALLAQNFEREYPRIYRNRGASVHTQFEMQTRDGVGPWQFMVIFSILALAVLLVACTNVAGLLLSRSRARTREIAVRLALGAGRFRLIRMLLTESLILACLGGLGGVAVGYTGIALLGTFSIPSELPIIIPFRLDTRVLLACLALSALSALFCGLAPALQSTRTDLVNGLKAADVDLPGRSRLWGRNLLVIAQIATSLMLLTAAFLMVRGFQHSLTQGTSFAKEHLLIAGFDPRLVQYNPAQTQRFYKLLVDRARQTPAVESAALTRNVPLGLDSFERLSYVPDDFQMPRDREHFVSTVNTVDPGFFDTMGVAIVQGRGFRESDTAAAPRVAVVNAQFAKQYWPGASAVGKHFRLDTRLGPRVEIIGVAETVKYGSTTERPRELVYLPLAQHPVVRMLLLLKSSGDPLQVVQPLKDMVRNLDPNLPILQTRTYQDLYRYNTVEGPAVASELVGTMGAVSLILAIAGLSGLIAYSVSRRTREIGIRIAIGAGPRDVLCLVLGQGLRLVALGTALGIAMGFAVERLLDSMLFGAERIDFTVYLVAVPSMLLVTLLAAYIPARRATRIAPTIALRYE